MSGVIYFASSGVDVWRIQALGRWGSEAIKGYLRNALLAGLTSLSAEANLGKSLETSRAELIALQVQAKKIRERLASTTEEDETLQAPPAPGLLPLMASDVLDGIAVAGNQADEPAFLDKPFVRNTKADGLLHVILCCPPATPSLWTSVCGWKFGRRAACAERTEDPIAAPACPRCFHIAKKRESSKAASSSSLTTSTTLVSTSLSASAPALNVPLEQFRDSETSSSSESSSSS